MRHLVDFENTLSRSRDGKTGEMVEEEVEKRHALQES